MRHTHTHSLHNARNRKNQNHKFLSFSVACYQATSSVQQAVQEIFICPICVVTATNSPCVALAKGARGACLC